LKWTHIAIHHSLTKDSQTVSWSAIRQYHTNPKPIGKGWSDIGYPWGIELVGHDYEIIMGRRMDRAGAHAREMGMNRKAIGICFVGNFDPGSPPENLLKRGDDLIDWLMDLYDIPPENILGHREIGLMAGFDWEKGQFKSCPGRRFDMDKFRERYA